MKWIWAHERLPDKYGSYYIRDYRYINNKKFRPLVSFFSRSRKSLIRSSPFQVQWLDESEDNNVNTVTDTIEKTKQAAESFLQWHQSFQLNLKQ